MIHKNFLLLNAMKGVAMGIAEVIPGVSGGTIAFITGIYERLLKSIKAIHPNLITIWKKEGFASFWKALDGSFLISLLGGMATGLVFGIFTITHLMETHPEPLWGFFFGLIVASIFVMSKEVVKWDLQLVISLLIGALVAYVITIISPTEGSTNLLYVYLAGTLAICALMLPGISGSFILLLMGMYTIIIPLVKGLLTSPSLSSFLIIGVFALGCLTGLTGFSRVLTWLFTKYKTVTFASMIGFLIGSLNKIWPWRNVTAIADKVSGNVQTINDYGLLKSLDKETYKILAEQNVLPSNYLMGEAKVGLTIFSLIAGLLIVLLISYLNNNKVNE
ncbi:MAG: DUF368 domain-containing protein [Saprospiraceae bacterium]|nr:DUF368 domain-containing protein [Saprospiraceae bacterium]